MGPLGWCLDHRRRRDPLVRVLSRQWPDDQHDFGDCSRALVNPTTGLPATGLRPVVVGLGTVASIAAIQTPTGPVWCFDGMGRAAQGSATPRCARRLTHPSPSWTRSQQRRAHARAPWSAHDIGCRDHGGVALDRARAWWWLRGAAHPDGEVAALARTMDLRERRLGRIIGFDNEGRVTSSLAFTWCPGSINTLPGPRADDYLTDS